MKVRVSEATGAVLDWMVSVIKENSKPFPIWCDGKPQSLAAHSTDWAHGGPIIEREQISTCWEGTTWVATLFNKNCGEAWYGHQYGPTPLVAAMRCFLSSKLGNEVEVPDELMEAK